jgi:hypothetical protein
VIEGAVHAEVTVSTAVPVEDAQDGVATNVAETPVGYVPTAIPAKLAPFRFALPLPFVVAEPTELPLRKKLTVPPLRFPPAANSTWACKLTVPPKVPVAGSTVVVVGGPLTVSVLLAVAVPPPPVAWTVKLVEPAGVAAVVESVKVLGRELSPPAKLRGLGENKAVTPVGSAVVTLSVALKAPPPLPERPTVIAYVTDPAVPTVTLPVCDATDTEPTFAASANAV